MIYRQALLNLAWPQTIVFMQDGLNETSWRRGPEISANGTRCLIM